MKNFTKEQLSKLNESLDDGSEWGTTDEFWDAWSPRQTDRIRTLIRMARVHAKSNRQVKNKKIGDKYLRRVKDEFPEPKDFYFAVDKISSKDGQPEYVLYVCFKHQWFYNGRKFPHEALFLRHGSWIDLLEGKTLIDADNGYYYHEGDNNKMEDHKKSLLKAGFEEKPDILDSL